MNFSMASPRGYQIREEILTQAQGFAAKSGAHILLTEQPRSAVQGADVVYTDVWTSMGQEAEAEKRRRDFASYQINAELLSLAKDDAILMHPMPVHHGEELAEGLINSPRSVLIDQAENRLHAQKGILAEILGSHD
jgi:ornithine carbamoyltransferase